MLVDDQLREMFLKHTPWRRRGPAPRLSDSESLAMEIIGEFLGYDTDEEIYEYFLGHWLDLFPALVGIGRTDFLKQAPRLAEVKRRLWQHLLLRMPHDPQVSVVDSFPLYACQFARAKRYRRFAEEAAFGHDELLRQTFYGFRWHLRVSWPGVITEVGLAPDMPAGASGWALCDRNYWSPELMEQLRQRGLELLAPPKKRSMGDGGRWSRWLTQKRRRIETVIGQLVERYQAKRTWARDAGHLLSRIFRKVLIHTVAAFLNFQRGGELLQFDNLIAH